MDGPITALVLKVVAEECRSELVPTLHHRTAAVIVQVARGNGATHKPAQVGNVGLNMLRFAVLSSACRADSLCDLVISLRYL